MESKHSKRRLAKKLREQAAWQLRLQGWSLPQIAAHLQIDKSSVSRYLTAMHAEWVAQHHQQAQEATVLDLARLDRLLSSVMPAASKGDCKSAMVAIRIIDMRARLLGCYAAHKVQVSEELLVNKEELQAQLLEKLESLKLA